MSDLVDDGLVQDLENRAEHAEARVQELELVLSRLAEWTHTFGSELKPRGADTYGEGVRDSKERVAKVLRGLSDPHLRPQHGLIVGTATFDFVFVRVAEAQALAKVANTARRCMRSEEDYSALVDALRELDASESNTEEPKG